VEAHQRHNWKALKEARNLAKQNYVQCGDAHDRRDKPESHENVSSMYAICDVMCVCVWIYVLEAHQHHQWKKLKPARNLDDHNYVQGHDAHGRWDKPESQDESVEYVCQWWCVHVYVYAYMYAYVCVHVSVLGMRLCTLCGLTDHVS
jgi:hypothetical protein